MIYAVAGNPVAHSKSPYIFNTHFTATDSDSVYTALAADKPSEIADTMRELGIRGCNVTAPFKDQVIPFCDLVSQEARELSSVNTLVLEEGKIHGYSTDGYGVSESLRSAVPDVQSKKALLIGAGGAGRMAGRALVDLGMEFTVINRTEEKAKKLADFFDGHFMPVEKIEKFLPDFDIVINTLPAGAALFSGTLLGAGTWLFDAIYTANPFRDEALKAGAKLIAGESWLLHQAQKSALYYFSSSLEGISPEKLSGFQKKLPKCIALTGFMGSGKSSVGEELAAMTSLPLIDIDKEIELHENESIENIFKDKGEPYFRKLESKLLEEFVRQDRRMILSCGGGIISDKKNNDLLQDQTYTVWVYAPLDASFERVHDAGRPLASDGHSRFISLFENRKMKYARSSDLLVRNFDKTPQECARRIYEEISLLLKYQRTS